MSLMSKFAVGCISRISVIVLFIHLLRLYSTSVEGL